MLKFFHSWRYVVEAHSIRDLFRFVTVAAVFLVISAICMGGDEWAEPGKVTEVAEGKRQEACVSWWGFDPEGSTEYLQAALNSKAEKLLVPKMDGPWITEPLSVDRDDLEVLFKPGVVIQARRGAFRGRSDCLLEIRGRENIVLKGYGARFRMWKEDYQQEPYSRAEWRHALSLRGVRNVKVLGLTFENSGGDGIYVGSGGGNDYSENIIIRNVVCDNNHRQGLSVVSVDGILVENSVFKNTHGTPPMAGIDCETHSPSQRLSNVVIRNNVLIDNGGYGMLTVPNRQTSESAPISILWESNYVRSSQEKGSGVRVAWIGEETPEGEIVFRNNIIEGTRHAGIWLTGNSSESGVVVTFIENVLYNVATGDSSHYRNSPIVLEPVRATSKPKQGNFRFENDFIYESREKDRPVIKALDRDEFDGWANVTGTINVNMPRTLYTDFSNITDTFDLSVTPLVHEHDD